ncbi:MAG: fasciclin domain-containing protein, partial [Chitinophagaceae bacterium]|nr:fasciclin domain-containing protein [Chitinophagaceae bacterium]
MKTNHILNAVILFACLATAISCTDDFKPVAPPSGSTITEIASGSNDFNILTAALTRTGLANTFANNNAGAFTVFAPTDAAFVAYFNAINIPTAGADEAAILTWINSTLSTTTSPSLSTLTSVLLYHVIISEVKSDKVTGAQGFVTLNGATRISISKV